MITKNKSKNKLKNRKAQIGLTLTWFVAFLVILVIMVVYLFSVVVISKKDISSSQLKAEDNSMDLKYLESQRKIEYLLNAPVEIDNKQKTIQIKDLIELWLKDETNYEEVLKKEIKDVLNSFEYVYYNYETSEWEVSINSLSIIKKETSSEKSISIGSAKYDKLEGINPGYVRKMNKGYVNPNSQEFYFALSTGESVKVVLFRRNPTKETYD